jgi:hypothetical protein
MWASHYFEERERRFTTARKNRSHKARRLCRRTLIEEAINDSDGALAPL